MMMISVRDETGERSNDDEVMGQCLCSQEHQNWRLGLGEDISQQEQQPPGSSTKSEQREQDKEDQIQTQ